MKRLFSGVIITSLIALSLVGCGVGNQMERGAPAEKGEAAAPDVRTIRAGIGLNEQHPQYKGLEKFKEIVERKTNGAIKVELFHSGQLGDDITMMEALQLGTQEMTSPSTAPIANFVPEFQVFDIPFLFPNEQVADKVLLESKVAQELLDKLQLQGMVGLAYWENGFRDVTNNTREVKSAADFKDLKIRTMENQLHLAAFEELGADPTPMAFSDLFSALQQGNVDGQENTIATIYLQKFNEVQKYLSTTHHAYSPFVLILSKKFWEESTPEQQEILKRAAKEAGDLERQLNREANAKYIEELKKSGMTVTNVTPEARDEMKAITDRVVEAFVDNIGKDVVDQVRAAVDAARK